MADNGEIQRVEQEVRLTTLPFVADMRSVVNTMNSYVPALGNWSDVLRIEPNEVPNNEPDRITLGLVQDEIVHLGMELQTRDIGLNIQQVDQGYRVDVATGIPRSDRSAFLKFAIGRSSITLNSINGKDIQERFPSDPNMQMLSNRLMMNMGQLRDLQELMYTQRNLVGQGLMKNVENFLGPYLPVLTNRQVDSLTVEALPGPMGKNEPFLEIHQLGLRKPLPQDLYEALPINHVMIDARPHFLTNLKPISLQVLSYGLKDHPLIQRSHWHRDKDVADVTSYLERPDRKYLLPTDMNPSTAQDFANGIRTLLDVAKQTFNAA